MKRKIRYLSLCLAILITCLAALTSCGDLFRKSFDDSVDLVEYVKERTVMLEVVCSDGTGGKGAGFFIDNEGTIVTCYHVIDGATEIKVKTSTGEHTATTVVNFSESNDIAVIKMETSEKTPYLKLYTDGAVAGEEVYAVGSPSVYDSIVTRGIVSAPNYVQGNVKCIVSDAYITNGNSGGPLVNEHGEVVGVCARGWSDSEGLGISVDISNLDSLGEDKNWKISEYKEWYTKEVQRSYRIYNPYSDDDSNMFVPSTVHTYQEVTEEECLYSTNTNLSVGIGAVQGYKRDYLYYVYEYSSVSFDMYTSYLSNRGFELEDSYDEVYETIDYTAYKYHNWFTHQSFCFYILNNQTMYVTSFIEYSVEK